MSMTGLLSKIFDIQINLIPLLCQYIWNLHRSDTIVTIIIYFTRDLGLKMISIDNLIFIQSQV